MKVCIVTLYNSENCGAFLQSFALGEKLKQLGHEVVYLQRSTDGTGSSSSAYIKTILKSFLKLDFKYARFKVFFHNRCLEDVKRFNTVSDISDVDYFVLGSDVIWQLRSKQFSENFSRYWGLDFPKGRSISYAPSTNGTPVEMFLNDERVAQALKDMKAVSVRDQSSLNTISQVTDRDIELVCDPTMLFGPEFYRSVQRTCPHERFMLVYAFHRNFCTKQQEEEIRAFAKAKGLKIISFGLTRNWCDLSVPYDSLAMPAYFDKADYVITNTFHGSVFSMIFHKQFVNFAPEKSKVADLHRQFQLEDRLVTKDIAVVPVLAQLMNMDALEERIEALRTSSIAYLERNLC